MSQNSALAADPIPYGPLSKADPHRSAFIISARHEIGFVDGVAVSLATGVVALTGSISFAAGLAQPGTDFVVFVYPDGAATAFPKGTEPGIDGGMVVGGFHYAPGGNAVGADGGDDIPAINPFSCWDLNFRPACTDPSGMVLIDDRFWCDIYLLGADHRDDGCTSLFGATIADGNDCPQRTDDGVHGDFNFHTAKAIYASHGKQLLGAEEFFAMAYGVTERSAAGSDPKHTALDAPRTSRHGVMQATGNMWTWGTDGHPEDPRASIFGGSWISGSSAGSRYAHLACWPGDSDGRVGARGRSDHLVLA